MPLVSQNKVFFNFDSDLWIWKIHQHSLKEPLKISKVAKFESDLLKTNEEIAPESCEILLMFVCGVKFVPPPYTNIIAYMPTLLDYPGVSQIQRWSPALLYGHHISRTKSYFELSCALVWDLAHFKLKTSISLFLGHFCKYLVIDKDYFRHQNDDCEIW